MSCAAALAADPPAQTFQTHCSACHAVDHVLVGPSLVEVAGIYRDNPDGFVKWCVKPEHKRDGFVEMPSMAHLGEPVLRELHAYVLSAASGKKEQAKSDTDPFAAPAGMVRRPQVMRIFLPEASPAAIAVALPGDLSFCFDASECRLRYVWKGGFIDGWPYFKANGSSLAKIDGNIVFRQDGLPFHGLDPKAKNLDTKFLGYKIGKDGVPSFRYRTMGVEVSETIRPLDDGKGIICEIQSKGPLLLNLDSRAQASVKQSTPPLLTSEEAKSFTLTYRWE